MARTCAGSNGRNPSFFVVVSFGIFMIVSLIFLADDVKDDVSGKAKPLLMACHSPDDASVSSGPHIARMAASVVFLFSSTYEHRVCICFFLVVLDSKSEICAKFSYWQHDNLGIISAQADAALSYMGTLAHDDMASFSTNPVFVSR